MKQKRINLDDLPDVIEELAKEQMELIAHDLSEIEKASESSGFSNSPDHNPAVLVRAKAIESNALTLALMMNNPRGYLEDVLCYHIEPSE